MNDAPSAQHHPASLRASSSDVISESMIISCSAWEESSAKAVEACETQITSYLYSTESCRIMEVESAQLSSFLTQTETFCAEETRSWQLRRRHSVAVAKYPWAPKITRTASNPMAEPSDSVQFIHWIQVVGHDAKILKQLSEHFELSSEAVKLSLLRHNLPTVQGHATNLFSIVRVQGLEDHNPHRLIDEQMSIFFVHSTSNHVPVIITVHETARLDDCFSKIREKLEHSRSRIRQDMDPSWWIYVFCDAIVDFSFEMAESFGARVGVMERDMLLAEPRKEHITEATILKKNLLTVRLNLWRMRELLVELNQDEFNVLSSATRDYLLDVYRHTENMLSIVEAQLALCTDLRNLYTHYETESSNDALVLLTNLTLYLMPAQFVCSMYSILPMSSVAYSIVMGSIAALVFATYLYVRYRSKQKKQPILNDPFYRAMLMQHQSHTSKVTAEPVYRSVQSTIRRHGVRPHHPIFHHLQHPRSLRHPPHAHHSLKSVHRHPRSSVSAVVPSVFLSTVSSDPAPKLPKASSTDSSMVSPRAKSSHSNSSSPFPMSGSEAPPIQISLQSDSVDFLGLVQNVK